MNDIIRSIEAAQMKTEVPQFNVGDTVRVSAKIKEGNRERIQVFEGVVIKKQGGSSRNVQVKQLMTFEALGQEECSELLAGDIGAVVGIDDADIGDMITSPDNPVDLPPITIEEPTMAIVFEASTSPLVGKDGDIVGSRQLRERLMREKESNISMRIEECEDGMGIEVAGRGVSEPGAKSAWWFMK